MKLNSFISKFKNQIANLSIYFLAAFIPMILSLVSNPYLAKNMSPADYAITGYYSAFNSLFSPLVTFYLLNYYTKQYYELAIEERKLLKATLFRALIFFSLFMSLISLLLLFIYSTYFNSESQIPFLPYALLSMLTLPLMGIYTLTLTEYRMSRESKMFFKLSVTNGVTGVLLALLLVVVFKYGAIGRMTATMLTAAILFIYVFIRNIDIWKYPFDKKIFLIAVKFCWPLVIASMLTFFCTGYDKVLLERQGDITSLGIYSVGVTIAGYLSLFSNSINDTFQPDIFESIVKRKFRRCLKFIVMKLTIMSMCVIGFAIFAPFIISILTFGRYVDSAPYAIIVAISSVTSMLYYSMSQITVALGYTKITLINKIIGSFISILSFHILVTNFGAIGAAWGIVFSYLYFFAGNALMVFYNYKKWK